ncbi:MAG: hypothetical protein ACK4NP_02535 [Parvularculaceae bacterium]
MKKFAVAAGALALVAGSFAAASEFEALCLSVSEDWATEGDVAGQCSCLAAKASANPALDAELRRLAETASSDEEAYEMASAAAKAAMDACSVDA